MKAKVIKRFRDKHTKKTHNLGTFYEGSEDRIQELQGFGWLGQAEEDAAKINELLDGSIAEVKTNTEGLSVDDLSELLEQEKYSKNRKGVIEHFESVIATREEPPDGEGE
jgi:hypothetical protein